MQTEYSPSGEFVHPIPSDIQTTPSYSFAYDLPNLPSADELYTSIPDAFNTHEQVPGFHFADPGHVQHHPEEDANNIDGYVPHDMLSAPLPMPTDVNSILACNDATRIPQVQPTFVYTQTSTGTTLRANIPAPFTYCIARESVETESIIPIVICQKLLDLRVMPTYPLPRFDMPDTRLYAQLISNFCQHKDDVTRRYYSKVPRDPCFPYDLQRPRIYPIELLKRLPDHLERYKDAFPKPLPMVIIRADEVIRVDPPIWYNMHGVVMHVLPTENPNTLWSMFRDRGVSDSFRPLSGDRSSVAMDPFQLGNMDYSPGELIYVNFAVNVFMEVPMFLGFASGLNEPVAAYKGSFILNAVNCPMDPAYWTELNEDRKMDIFNRAPQLFNPFLLCPNPPAINLRFQNWDMNLLGVLDDLKFGAVDDSIDWCGRCEQCELGLFC